MVNEYEENTSKNKDSNQGFHPYEDSSSGTAIENAKKYALLIREESKNIDDEDK